MGGENGINDERKSIGEEEENRRKGRGERIEEEDWESIE